MECYFCKKEMFDMFVCRGMYYLCKDCNRKFIHVFNVDKEAKPSCKKCGGTGILKNHVCISKIRLDRYEYYRDGEIWMSYNSKVPAWYCECCGCDLYSLKCDCVM